MSSFSFKKYVLLLGLTILFSRCVSLNRSIYLQGDMAQALAEVEKNYQPDKTSYLVKPNDNLYIRINSLDERTSSFLNNESQSTTRIDNPMAASLSGYRVEEDGSIQFPFVGNIMVANLTIDQIRQKIQEAVSKYIEECHITVKLLNDNITIIGEVRLPGRFLLYDEDINLLEAISLAGDMTDFANRKKVRLIRKDGEVQQMVVINTLDDNLLYSPFFHLKPGDIIYVEPSRLKSVNLSAIPIGLSLTVLNTTLLVLTFYLTLNQD